jgi:hypothetical protein
VFANEENGNIAIIIDFRAKVFAKSERQRLEVFMKFEDIFDTNDD